MKIIVTAGGTMGHINPALAIIEEFKREEKDLEIIYIGTHNRMEKEIIPKKGIHYEEIEIYGFSKDIKRDIKNIGCINRATKKCLQIMREFKPDVVIGTGGYVTYPVLKAAHKLHIKTFIHEQNSIPGKSNKMISRYADLIGVTFLSSKKYFKTNKKIIYTGNPSASWALLVPKKDKESLGFTKGKKLLTIVAGSLGSESLNEKFKDFIINVKPDNYEICYITGKSLYDKFVANFQVPDNVKVFPFMDELPGLIKCSDAVISRAGAGSLSEILVLKVPALIIPSPYVANNHQYYNAKEFSDKGLVLFMNESDITNAKLKENIDNLLFSTETRYNLINNMEKESTLNSANYIYKSIKEIINN